MSAVPWWDWLLVALAALAAAVYLVHHYAAGRRARAAGNVCGGDCAHCPFADSGGGCADPDLRDSHLQPAPPDDPRP